MSFSSGFLMYAAVKSLGCDDFECLWEVTQSSTLVTCSFQLILCLLQSRFMYELSVLFSSFLIRVHLMTVYSNMLSVAKEINFPVFLSVFVILCYVVHFACKCTLHVARCLLTVALNFKHIALHAAVADFNILVTSAELL